jgi:DNA invertase Pin-like site-specific DNA recombinase
MADFIAYYRVSTDKQGAQGLGMDAQREAVTRFIGQRGQIVGEYVEVESGRKNNRPELIAALSAVTLKRIDESRKIHRFYLLAVQPELFGRWSLIREWGRIGQPG